MAKKSKTPIAPAASSKSGSTLIRTVLTHLIISIVLTLSLHLAQVNLFQSNFQTEDTAKLNIIRQEDAHPMLKNESVALAEEYFNAAISFSGEAGEGNKGWWFLLAAYDLDPTNEHYLRSLVDNYINSGYTDLGIDELFSVLRRFPGNKVALSLLEEVKQNHPETWEIYKARLNEKLGSEFSNKLNPPKLTLPFSTAIAQYFISKQFPQLIDFHQDFYDATMEAYNIVKKDWRSHTPDITETEINHKFFQWQMAELDRTGDYWSGYRDLPLFSTLIKLMREAAANFLMSYGMDEEAAIRKASHNIIFWASVHTGNSIHEPHMTEDALIGGVYYVSIPEKSGKLGLFDPRGRSPMLDPLVDKMTSPPFHRTMSLTPEEGMMVLFPGWLVHTVLPSYGLNVHSSKYRISISVNLKGEWQDTAGLMLENVEIKTKKPKNKMKPEL